MRKYFHIHSLVTRRRGHPSVQLPSSTVVKPRSPLSDTSQVAPTPTSLPAYQPTPLPFFLPSHANGSFTNRNWASASPRDLVRVKEISSSRFAMAQGQPNPNEVTTPARFFASLLRRDITSSPKEMTRESDLLRRSCSGRRSTAPGWSPSTARASSTASTIEWCALLAREMFDYKWLEC